MLNVFLNSKEMQIIINSLPGIKKIEKEKEIDITIYIKDPELIRIVAKLYRDGHHARAVEEGYKLLNNIVKRRAAPGLPLDGSSLMKHTFSLSKPVLLINTGQTQSERDEQLGYMEIFSGCMTGIRNPRAHEHDWEDTQHHALQLLILAGHLIEKVKNAKKI